MILKEEIHKFIKEIKTQSNNNKHLKETHKTVQDLKAEIEAIKKAQIEGILEMKILGQQRYTTEAKFTHIIETEERILDIEDKIEGIDTSVKENVKSKKFLKQPDSGGACL